MFWGLVMEPGKRYVQTVDKSFHISMASLDVMHSKNGLVSVNVNFQNLQYILCNLQKNYILQTPLDLNFMAGDRIAFYTSGNGRVHLTGYLLDDDDDDLGVEAEDEESEEDVTPQKNAVPTIKQDKRKSTGQTLGKPALKKSKMESEDDEDGDDDDDDDSDLESIGDSDEEIEEEDDDDGEEDEGEDDSDELQEMPHLKWQPQGKNKGKQQSAHKQQQNKVNTPNERKKKKGAPETQLGQKSKKKGGDTPGDKGGQTRKQALTDPLAHTSKQKILEGGMAVEDTVVGSGEIAKPGRFVTVYFTGRLKQNNKKFDENVKGPGYKFRLGKGEVIKGYDIGITGMKVGGKRKLIIPPHMAYGAKGLPPVIPPNSTLVVEVELRNVN